MNNKLQDAQMDYLFRAVLKLETMDECYRFFEDLCTVPELKAMAQRIEVAHMLKKHCVYNDIVKKTGASTATISRVNRSLLYGTDGYQLVLDRLQEEEKDETKQDE